MCGANVGPRLSPATGPRALRNCKRRGGVKACGTGMGVGAPARRVLVAPRAADGEGRGEAKDAVPGEEVTDPIKESGLLEASEDVLDDVKARLAAADFDTIMAGGGAWVAAQFAILFLMLVPIGPVAGLVKLACGPVALAYSIFIIAFGAQSLGAKNLTALPEPTEGNELVTTGAYAICRHPLYSGLLVGAFGFATVTEDPVRFGLIGALWYVLEHKAAREERQLAAKHGQAAYDAYADKTPRYIPDLTKLL